MAEAFVPENVDWKAALGTGAATALGVGHSALEDIGRQRAPWDLFAEGAMSLHPQVIHQIPGRFSDAKVVFRQRRRAQRCQWLRLTLRPDSRRATRRDSSLQRPHLGSLQRQIFDRARRQFG